MKYPEIRVADLYYAGILFFAMFCEFLFSGYFLLGMRIIDNSSY